MLDAMQLRFTYVPRDLAKGDQHADISTIWQTQYSLVPLFELETDLTLKASWKEALSTCSRIVRKFGGDGPELQIVLLAQNRDLSGPEPVTPDDARLHRELEGAIARLLSRTPREQIDMAKGNVLASSMTHFGVTWLSAAETYWTAILRKVIRPGSEPPSARRTDRR